MSKDNCCQFLRGRVAISTQEQIGGYGYNYGYCYGTTCPGQSPGRFIGNVESLTVSPIYTTKEAANSFGVNYSKACSAGFLEKLEISMSVPCKSAENIATALYGDCESYTSSAVGTPVVDEIMVSDSNGFVCDTIWFFEFAGVDCSTVVIKRADNGQVLVQGVDYSCNTIGVTFLQDFAFVGTDLLISYGYQNNVFVKKINAFTKEPEEITLTFVGENIAGKKDAFGNYPIVRIKFPRVKFSPTSSLNIISTEFDSLDLSGEIIRGSLGDYMCWESIGPT